MIKLTDWAVFGRETQNLSQNFILQLNITRYDVFYIMNNYWIYINVDLRIKIRAKLYQL
jgi:hypothetical protein